MQLAVYFVLFTRSVVDLIGLMGIGMLGFAYNALVLGLGVLSVRHVKSDDIRFVTATWLPLIAVETLSLVTTPTREEGLRLILQQLTYPAIMICVFAHCTNKRQLTRILQLCIASAALPALISIFQIGSGGILTRHVSGTFAHPNILALYCVIVLYAIYLMRMVKPARSQHENVFTLAFAATLTFVLLATQTRGAWLGFACSVLVVAVLAERRALILLVGASSLIFVPTVQQRIIEVVYSESQLVTQEDLLSGRIIADSFTWRKVLWSEAIEYSQDKRVFGKGVGSFRSGTEMFFPAAPGMDSHSAYIQTIYEIGIVGLLCFIITLLVPLFVAMRAFKSKKKSSAIVIALVVMYAVFSYGDNSIYYLVANWYYWTVISVLICILRTSTERAKSFSSSRAGEALTRSAKNMSKALR